jgi:hypothetical protein
MFVKEILISRQHNSKQKHVYAPEFRITICILKIAVNYSLHV